MNYGEKVKHARKSQGVSATALAKHLGVSQPTISQVEKGLYKLSDENALKMAVFLKVPINYFLQDEYVSLDEFNIDTNTKKLLQDNNLVNYIVLADKAQKENISIEDLEQAINFIIQIKKQGS